MKILFISSGKSGKVGEVVKNQGESLRQFGLEIDYFIIKPGLWGYINSLSKLKKTFIQGKYDLAHAHYALSGLLSVLSVSREKVLVSYMGCDIYGDYNKNGSKMYSSYFVVFLGFILQLFVKKIIVKSQNLEHRIYLKSKVYLIPNGVNLDVFKPYGKVSSRTKLGLSQNKKYVLFMGNPLDSRKNFRLVKEIKENHNLDFEILNPYPVNNKEVPAYLSAADLLILTSFNEGSPNIIKEAMACNCPIVATDVGDVKWVLGDVDGCNVVSFESEMVAEKVREALDTCKRTNGRNRIIELGLDSETIARKLVHIYRGLVTGST